MNFYPFHIGDYAKETAHLSMTEDGAYRRLLDMYYTRECRLPCDVPSIYRLARAHTKLERAAIDVVLQEFFKHTETGFLHHRCEEEIENAQSRISAAQRNGRKGGRPKKAEPSRSQHIGGKNPLGFDQEPTGLTVGYENETREEAHQSQSQSQSQSIDEVPTVLVERPSTSRHPQCPTEHLIDCYHRHLPTLPRVEILNSNRKKAISGRWRDVLSYEHIANAADPGQAALEWFDSYFQHVARSDFLTGRVKDWRADFDFLVAPAKFTKVVEGHYHQERGQRAKQRTSSRADLIAGAAAVIFEDATHV